MKPATRLGRLVHAAVITAAVVWTLFPLYWVVVSSFKHDWEILQWPPTPVPLHPTLGNYARLFGEDRFQVYMLNSLIVSLGASALSLALGSPAAYALARLGVPAGFANAFLVWVLLVRMLPPITIALPLFVLMRNLGLADTRLGLILAYQVYTLPYAIWLLHGFFTSIPRELEWAAMVDGATLLQTLARVVLPVVAPGLVAAFTLGTILSWNEFLLPLILINSPDKYPVTVVVANYIQEYTIQWGMLAASGVASALPVIALSFYIQRYMTRGLAYVGLKG